MLYVDLTQDTVSMETASLPAVVTVLGKSLIVLAANMVSYKDIIEKKISFRSPYCQAYLFLLSSLLVFFYLRGVPFFNFLKKITILVLEVKYVTFTGNPFIH